MLYKRDFNIDKISIPADFHVDKKRPGCYTIHCCPAEKPDPVRVCWNRQTGTFEGRVSTDVRVQVPSLAPCREPRYAIRVRGFFVALTQNICVVGTSFLHLVDKKGPNLI